MKELITNRSLFDIKANNIAICITTNGMTKRNGTAVMGKGIALEAVNKYGQNLAIKLGKYLKQYGNRVFNMGVYDCRVITFPTKYDWHNKSNMDLIVKSAHELVEVCDKFGVESCYLPPVGCGCGGLNWSNVKKELEKILDDRFIVILRK